MRRRAGAAALLLQERSRSRVFAYYRQLIERVNNPTLRIVLYHIPAVSGVPLTLSLIERLVTAFPQHIVGVKDSSGIGTT